MKELEEKLKELEEAMSKKESIKAEISNLMGQDDYSDMDEINENIPDNVRIQMLEQDVKKQEDKIFKIKCDIAKNKSQNKNKEYGEKYTNENNNGFKFFVRKQTDKSVNDILDRSVNVKSVADKIINREVKNVGVFGTWGSGKSTFLSHIKEKINENANDSKKFCFIELDASEYSDQEQIWANIYEHLKEKYDESESFSWLRFFGAKWKRNKSRYIKFFLGYVAIFFICLLALYPQVIERMPYISKYWNESVELGIDIFAILLFVFKVVIPALYKCVPEVNNIMKKMGSFWKLPTLKDKIECKETIREYTSLLFQAWNSKQIVILVDEMDRSSADTIKAFFQAIQLFDDIENLHIIYAIDKEALSKAYKDDKFITDPIKYVEKYIDIGIYLDNKLRIAECINELMDNSIFTSEEKEITKLEMIRCDKKYSIRQIIQMVNVLIVAKQDWYENCMKKRMFETKPDEFFNFTEFIQWAVCKMLGGESNIDYIEKFSYPYRDKYIPMNMLSKIDYEMKGLNDQMRMEGREDIDWTINKIGISNVYTHDIILYVRHLEKYYE